MSIPSCGLGDDQGQIADQALTAKQASALLAIHVVTLWQQVADGRLPRPFYPAPRAPRWWRSKLIAAADRTTMLPADARAARRERRLANT